MKITFLEDHNTGHIFLNNMDTDLIDPADLGSGNLRSCLTRQDELDNDEPMIPFDFAEPVDDYFDKVYGADRLEEMREVW